MYIYGLNVLRTLNLPIPNFSLLVENNVQMNYISIFNSIEHSINFNNEKNEKKQLEELEGNKDFWVTLNLTLQIEYLRT